jgi:hypothetical protein
MTEYASQCLDQDDARMFYKGACHIFAVALKRYRRSEQYELCRVVCNGLGAYHVYARSHDWLVDVGGLKRETDYLHWLRRRALENEWNSPITFEPVSEADLLQQTRTDELRGFVNEWGLFTDPDFVLRAMERAKILVEDSDRYRASLMR